MSSNGEIDNDGLTQLSDEIETKMGKDETEVELNQAGGNIYEQALKLKAKGVDFRKDEVYAGHSIETRDTEDLPINAFLDNLTRYARIRFRHHQEWIDGKDLAQDVMDLFPQNFAGFDPTINDNYTARFAKLCKQVLSDHLKKEGRQKRGGDMNRVNNGNDADILLEEIVDERSDSAPESDEKRERKAKFADAVSQLNDRQQTIITRYAEEKSPKDIAEELGISESAVKASKSRAMKRIRELCGTEENSSRSL